MELAHSANTTPVANLSHPFRVFFEGGSRPKSAAKMRHTVGVRPVFQRHRFMVDGEDIISQRGGGEFDCSLLTL